MSQTDLCTAIDTALNGTGITVTYNAGNGLYQFRSLQAFTLKANSTLLAFLGFEDIDHVASPVYQTYALSSPNAIDLTGNNSFYFTTNLNTGDYNFISPTGYGRGSNILEKMQLDDQLVVSSSSVIKQTS